jgi:hypothetical protein
VKKYLALLLIAIMAVSVLSAAGVVTTQKAAAQPPVSVSSATGIVTTQKTAAATLPPVVVVNYKPGATYKYAPWQFNYNYAYFDDFLGTNIQHAETTGVGTAYSSIHTTQTQSGDGYSGVGMYWQLNLPSGSTWATVKNMPCTVTVMVTYFIQAKGNQHTFAEALWGVYAMNPADSSVYGNNPQVKTATITQTWHTTVGNVFSGDSIGPYYGGGGAQVDTGQYPAAGAGQTSAIIVCSSVVLAFPQAP